ncbi:hypothetical protein VTN31DRAFT_1112 [Thermomyces dupontii]|uniref:uncharacterized protein n=1 Tax=Talaromyces thermophilus TaxID=28565 RepID=UPI00374224A3
MDPSIERELARLDPDVPFRATQNHIHHTWARTFYSLPELYIQPQSLEEIQKVVKLAGRCRRRVVVVGSGHSPSDLTCTSSWVVNLDHFNRVLHISPDGVVTVQAGIRLRDLGEQLERHGWTLPNLGSIDAQSIAGAITTGTHGSSVYHGLLSECIRSLAITLANGQTVHCSATNNPSLFRAALVSLGALGIITEVTLQATRSFRIAWKQSLYPLSEILENWSNGLWTSHHYVRVWWLPYMKRAVVWHADKTDLPLRAPPTSFYGGRLGYHIYHNLLALARWFPRILPWVEWFVFGMQYGFKPKVHVTEAVETARKGLLMDCLYSQFVNEWALPLEKGPEAITRLSAWIHGDEETARIPFSSKGVYVHSPVEVRVSDSTVTDSPHPYLDPSCRTGPTLYLNTIMYRPYRRDPPGTERYYQAFEWLMRELGGRPHWAKFFSILSPQELRDLYGSDMDEWLKVRNEVDPDGMFLGAWHRRNLLLPSLSPVLSLEEQEQSRRRFKGAGSGDGLEWIGDRRWDQNSTALRGASDADGNFGSKGDFEDTSSPLRTSASEESFDIMSHGEASIISKSE